MKKVLVFIIIFLFLSLGIVGVTMFLNAKKLKVIFTKNIALEINTEHYNTDFIESIKNGEVVSPKELIDTSSLGKKEITIIIKDYFNKEQNYSYKLLVVDTISPTITFKKELSTTEGKKIDLLKGVKVEDNSKESIKVTVKGEYDFNTPGTYNLLYVASDSSNNTTEEKFTLKVKKKKEVKNVNINNTSNTTKNEDGSFTTSKGFKGVIKNGNTYINDVLIVNKTYSLSENYNPGLTKTVKAKFNEMFEAAKEDGFTKFYIGSGFRSYAFQQKLYNNYVKRDGVAKADTYSARAGHSEHQSGLAADICHKGYPCVTSRFDNTEPAKWLNDNCYKYGFIIRFPKGKTNETGYKYESWHLRYVGVELATKLYNNGDWISLENYFGITSTYE